MGTFPLHGFRYFQAYFSIILPKITSSVTSSQHLTRSTAEGSPLPCGHPLPLGRHCGERNRAFLISPLCLHNPSFCWGIFSSLQSPGERAKFRLLEGKLALSVLCLPSAEPPETNPAQSCPGALLWLKKRKSPIPESLPRIPHWNEPGVHGKTAQGRGRVGFIWESKFSSAQKEQSTWKKPWEAGNSCFDVLRALSQ